MVYLLLNFNQLRYFLLIHFTLIDFYVVIRKAPVSILQQ